MLIPLEQDYLSWAAKFNIRVKTGNCPRCNQKLLTNIPFALQGYRGLKSDDHGCGEKYTRKVMIPYDSDAKSYWQEFAEVI